MEKRKDIHRPSTIVPGDYTCIGWDYLGPGCKELDIMELRDERDRVREIMTLEGYKYAQHEHGGSCSICGAYAHYVVLWVHLWSSEVIRSGETCANKMGLHEPEVFQKAKNAIVLGRQFLAGKARLREALQEYGGFEGLADRYLEPMPPHFQIEDKPAEIPPGLAGNAYGKAANLAHMLNSLRQYGDWSVKQQDYARILWQDLQTDPWAKALEITRGRESARLAATPAPEGRLAVQGVVLNLKEPDEDAEYPSWKMMMRVVPGGWKAWCTRPAAIQAVKKGDKVELTATWKPSDRDDRFAFGGRPSKARILTGSREQGDLFEKKEEENHGEESDTGAIKRNDKERSGGADRDVAF